MAIVRRILQGAMRCSSYTLLFAVCSFTTVAMCQTAPLPEGGMTASAVTTPSSAAAGRLSVNRISGDLKKQHHADRTVTQLPEELKLMRNHVRRMQVKVVKSFMSPSGETVDCVKINDQAVFRGNMLGIPPPTAKAPCPLAQVPSTPNYRRRRQRRHRKHLMRKKARRPSRWRQRYMANGRCNEGSVPVLRRTLEHYRRHRTLRGRLRKHQSLDKTEDPSSAPAAMHEYSLAHLSTANYGVSATLNVWNPFVEEDHEFTLSQVWVTATPATGTGMQTLEAGWMVYPGFYGGDRQTRLFAYWTADDYNETGCYNLECAGFVQTSNTILLGDVIPVPSSMDGGPQYEIKISIVKDVNGTGDWWLQLNDECVGYWPQSLFDNAGSSGLQGRADYVAYGGEVVNTRSRRRHTGTDMGSGEFGASGFEHAAYQAECMYVDPHFTWRVPDAAQLHSTNPTCYNIVRGDPGTTYGNVFYFGGSGRNSKCR